MLSHDKETLQPFLHDDQDEYATVGLGQHTDHNSATSQHQPIPPKNSAKYAIACMLGAQILSAAMNTSIKLLADAPSHFHPLQILFVRMSVTTLGTTILLWQQNTPHNILGKKENRLLLLARALGGSLGVFGLYYSLAHLKLSEVTVITFMLPLMTSLATCLVRKLRISALESILTIICLAGLVLMATPSTLFAGTLQIDAPEALDFATRLVAICVGLLGVCGSAAAFLCLSAIGKTEHPLTVVNYLAAVCTLVSFLALLVLPGMWFQMPSDSRQWFLLLFSCFSGIVMQILVTRSLQAEKSMVAVNMVYMQIVFALALDGIVFQMLPQAMSLGGCALICGSAFLLAWCKTKAQHKASSLENGHRK